MRKPEFKKRGRRINEEEIKRGLDTNDVTPAMMTQLGREEDAQMWEAVTYI